MFDRERTLYAFTLAYCEKLVAEIPQEQMEHSPAETINPPAWQLGHLAICTDFALQLMGFETQLPEEWRTEFGPGTKPQSQGYPYPSKEELWTALSTGHKLVSQASESVTEEELAPPHPIEMEILQKFFPTVGDLLAHLMTSHEAMHLGHLSSWRRQMGLPPIF